MTLPEAVRAVVEASIVPGESVVDTGLYGRHAYALVWFMSMWCPSQPGRVGIAFHTKISH